MYQKAVQANNETANWIRNDSASTRMLSVDASVGKDGPALAYVQKFASHLRIVQIDDGDANSAALSMAIVQLCTNITVVDFWSISWHLLYDILKRNCNVQELKIWRVLHTAGNVTPNSVHLHLPRLRVLTCQQFQFIKPFLLKGLSITVLDLDDNALRPSQYQLVPKLFPHLRALALSSTNISDEMLHIITLGCPRILHLDLHECTEVTDKGIKSVVTNLEQLISLNIEYCDNLSNASLIYIYTHCAESLRMLCLNSWMNEYGDCGPFYEDEVMDTLLETCQNIETFRWGETCEENAPYVLSRHIKNVSTLTLLNQALCDDNLRSVAEHCPNLRNLSICFYGDAGDDCYTHEGLKSIVFGCPQLQKLHIYMKPGENELVHPYVGLTLDLWRALRPKLTIHDSRTEIPCFEFNILTMTV